MLTPSPIYSALPKLLKTRDNGFRNRVANISLRLSNHLGCVSGDILLSYPDGKRIKMLNQNVLGNVVDVQHSVKVHQNS